MFHNELARNFIKNDTFQMFPVKQLSKLINVQGSYLEFYHTAKPTWPPPQFKMHSRFMGKIVVWLIKTIILLADISGFGCFQKNFGNLPFFFYFAFLLADSPHQTDL